MKLKAIIACLVAFTFTSVSHAQYKDWAKFERYQQKNTEVEFKEKNERVQKKPINKAVLKKILIGAGVIVALVILFLAILFISN